MAEDIVDKPVVSIIEEALMAGEEVPMVEMPPLLALTWRIWWVKRLVWAQ